MKQHKIENQRNQNLEEEKRESEGVGLAIIGLLFLPFLIVFLYIQKKATSSKTWRIVDYYSKAKRLALPSIIISLSISLLSIQLLKGNHPKWAVAVYLITWITTLPLWVISGNLHLQNIASSVSKGAFDLSQLAAVKRAMLRYGFERAEKVNIKIGSKLPKRGKKGEPIVAINAQSPDFRKRTDKKRMPDRYVLDARQDGDFVTFQVSGTEFPHHLVIGATGSGKTTLLSRMTLTALQENYRVVFIDFKGGQAERNLITGIGSYLDRPIKVVGWPGSGINLFTGSADEIADRVIGFLPGATGGAGDYYRSRLMTAIIAVVVRSGMTPPKSADELIDRVRNGLSFCSNEQDRDFFSQKEKGNPIGHDISTSLAAYLNPLRRAGEESTSNGFTWNDDWDLAFIQLNSTQPERTT